MANQNDVKIKIVVDGADKAKKELGSLSKSTKNIGKGITNVGKQMTLATAPIAAALAVGAKTAIDFESAFAGVRKTVEASEEEFKQLDKNLKDISATTPVTYDELARIGELAGQLGVSGVNNLTKFTDTMAKMAVTTNLTSEEAATAFARIANIMGEPIENVDKMGSVIVALGNNFATTEADITNFASRIAGAGRIAGLTTSQIFAIGAAMSSVGVEAEAGGTAVQKVLLSMNQAVISNSEDLKVFAKTAGFSAKEFKEVWEEDAMAGFTLFVEGLGKSGDEAIGILEDLGLQDQRLIRSFLSLANAGELLNDTYNLSAKAWMKNNALSEEAEKRFATTESQLIVLKNNIRLFAAEIGAVLLPIINSIVNKLLPVIQDLAKRFANLPDGLKKAIIIFGLLAVAIGPLLLVIGPLVTGFGALLGVIGFILSPVGLLVIAIAGLLVAFTALGAVLIEAVGGWGSIKEAIENFWNSEAVKAVREWLGNVIKKLEEGLPSAIDTAKTKLGEFKDSVNENLNSEEVKTGNRNLGKQVSLLAIDIPKAAESGGTALSGLSGPLGIFSSYMATAWRQTSTFRSKMLEITTLLAAGSVQAGLRLLRLALGSATVGFSIMIGAVNASIRGVNSLIRVVNTLRSKLGGLRSAMKLPKISGGLLGSGGAEGGVVVPAFQTGGIVPGMSTTGDKVLARVNSGEMILNSRQQGALFRILDMLSKRPQTINVSGNNFGGQRSPMQQENNFMGLLKNAVM